MCIHVLAVCVCSESMNDVTDNAKNNFGNPLDAMYIACARSVSENDSDNFDFLGNAFSPRCDAIAMILDPPPLDPPMRD